MLKELSQKFGVSQSTPLSFLVLSQIQSDAFSGDIGSEFIRPICWRLFFGCLSTKSQNAWADDLNELISKYRTLKKDVIPKMVAKVDPLMALLDEASEEKSPEWERYYKSVELGNFIKGDLERLYVTGIEDEYFEDQRIRDILLNVLLVWALAHPHISYRQGMHEVCGPILHVLEREFKTWNDALTTGTVQPDSHALAPFFVNRGGMDAFLEANCFALLDCAMEHMEPLYDPTNGPDGLAQIVKFCSKIQEHYLRQYDSRLCDVLEERCIQSHLYGMKWTRLLFGREFAITPDEGLRIWDFIFCYCLDTQGTNAQPSDVLSEISNANTSKQAMLAKARYGPHSLLLAGISDFMLAMILAIRDELLDSDECMCLALLMRYPQPSGATGSIHTLINTADEIRRGAFKPHGHQMDSGTRSSSGARRQSFNRNNLGASSQPRTPPPAEAGEASVSESELNALDSLLGGTSVSSQGTTSTTSVTHATTASSAHKDSVNSWLNSAPSIPLFLSDGLQAGKRAATSMLFSPNTPPGENISATQKSLMADCLDMDLGAPTGAAGAKSGAAPLFPTEQTKPPRVRKRDIIKNLIMPSKPVAAPLVDPVDDEEHMEISHGHTALAMVSKAHPPHHASGPATTNTIQPCKVVGEYDSHSVGELVEDRLRTLSELLRECPLQTEAAKAKAKGTAVGKGNHSHGGDGPAVTPAFIADKMDLLADILGGLYSVPEYDGTFVTLVGSDGGTVGKEGSQVGPIAGGSMNEEDPLGMSGGAASASDRPPATATTPAKKSVLISQGYAGASHSNPLQLPL